MSKTNNLRLKIISDLGEFSKLRQPWNELVRQCSVDHAFMRHEWFECWLKDLGDIKSMLAMTLWSGSQMVAAAPLQIKIQKIRGLPHRVMSFMSSSITPRCNFIIHSSVNPEEFYRRLFKVGGWDLLLTQNLETDEPTTKRYIEYLNNCRRGNYDIEPGRLSPFQLLDTDWETYFNRLSKNHRKNIRVAFKRLEAAPSFAFEQYDDFGRVESLFDEMTRVSGASWKAQTGSDLLSNQKIAAFYKNFSRVGSPDGLWQIYMLKIDGRYAAFDYLLKHNNRLTGIRSDYANEFRHYYPGHLMKVSTIKDLCARETPWEYDMGGMAADYKLNYTEKIREHVHITASASGIYGHLLLFGKRRILPFVKKLRQPEESAPEIIAPAGESG